MEHEVRGTGYMEWWIDGGKKLPVEIQDKLTDIFLEKYFEVSNLWACVFNSHIKDWNSDFDKLHPELDGYSKEYNRFIACKEKRELKKHSRFFRGIYWKLNIILRYDKQKGFWYPAEIFTINLFGKKLNGQFHLEDLEVL